MFPQEPFPLTLTPASWLSVVSNCLPPATTEQLARAASTLLAEETFLRIAARFPVKAAVEIAGILGPDNGGSILDVHAAQLSLSDLLLHQPDFNLEDSAIVTEIGNTVLGLRAKWQTASYTENKARTQARMEAEFERSGARLAASEEHARGEVIAHRRTEKDAVDELARVKTLYPRRALVLVVLVVLLGAAAWLFSLHFVVAALFTLVAGTALFPSAWEWMRDERAKWYVLVIPAAIELLGLILQLVVPRT